MGYTLQYDENADCGFIEVWEPEPVYEFEYKGHRVEVWPCHWAENERETCDGMLTYLALYHPRYNIGDGLVDGYTYDSSPAARVNATVAEVGGDDPIVIPVTMMDHSGITLAPSVELAKYLAGMHWDMSRVGYAVVNKARARELHGWKRISKKRLAALYQEAAEEIRRHGQYINGEVYTTEVFGPDGEKLDTEPYQWVGLDEAETEAKRDIDAALS